MVSVHPENEIFYRWCGRNGRLAMSYKCMRIACKILAYKNLKNLKQVVRERRWCWERGVSNGYRNNNNETLPCRECCIRGVRWRRINTCVEQTDYTLGLGLTFSWVPGGVGRYTWYLVPVTRCCCCCCTWYYYIILYYSGARPPKRHSVNIDSI